jgi:iron(III) transport system substrate-binding protein
MRYLYFLILLLCTSLASAQNWEDRQLFNGTSTQSTIRILSSTDTSFFAPILNDFVSKNPSISVEYFVTGTADIDNIFRTSPADFDIVISSAMDLQLKLVNDGFARQVGGTKHPNWAQWRDSLFGFTAEPAAIVVNRAAFNGHSMPRTRQDLIRAMRARPQIFANRIGTYDVRKSGLGYLFATQDARASETYWRLTEVMGSLGTRLYCCSGEMIDDLVSGKIAVAYNVLGSYASARNEVGDAIEVILPSDFPTTMMRTAFVANETENTDAAQLFLRHLIGAHAKTTHKLPTLDTVNGDTGQSTIALGPALMTYLDRLKRKQFIKEWEDAIIQ